MTTVFIGIDDTDFGDSAGTGQLARRLSREVTRVGGTPLGITRHQFLIDPRIAYTGHNRGICLATEWHGTLADLEFVYDLVRQWSAMGSDPGVCVATREVVPAEIVAWGERALREVLTMDEARDLATQHDLDLRPLGGTGLGIIGALAGVGLRSGGAHGRFVDMPGLRELGETVTIHALASMGMDVEPSVPANSPQGRVPHERDNLKTLGWVRPRLCNGRPLLAVQWSDEHDAWIPVDRKKIHSVE